MSDQDQDMAIGAAEVKETADKFYAWQQEHIAAPDANLTVSVVYALTSHFKDTVPVMPNLVFYATMNTSGKSTAAQALVDVGNFSPDARVVQRMTSAAIIRLADGTKQGVRIEDLHLYRPYDPIHDFLVNSFKARGKQAMANRNDQKKLVYYEIGATPIVITTNDVHQMTADAKRRSIQLPMIRQTPKRYTTDEEQAAALEPIAAAFEGADCHEAVKGQLSCPMPGWMDEPQKHRWLPLFAVCRAVLGPEWTQRLEEAARHLEGVTKTANQTEELLADIWSVRASEPKSVGILPGVLYTRLRDLNPDQWGELTDTKLGRLLKVIQDADGRTLPKLNVPAGAFVVADFTYHRGAKYFPWEHFEDAWRAYRIDQPVCAEAA